MKTTFDEADYIIPHKVVTAFQEGKWAIRVISADTDVFLLLCHFYKSINMNAEVLLEGFNNDWHISIRKTVEENISIVSSFLSAHALSGCHTGKLIKVLPKFPLTCWRSINAEEQEYIKDGKLFVARCYGMTNINSAKNR